MIYNRIQYLRKIKIKIYKEQIKIYKNLLNKQNRSKLRNYNKKNKFKILKKTYQKH